MYIYLFLLIIIPNLNKKSLAHNFMKDESKSREELLSELSCLRKRMETEASERKRADDEYKLNLLRLEALVKLNQMAEAPLSEIADFVLEQGVLLTQSRLGYIAFLNPDETAITIHSWSKTAMAECRMIDKPIVYELVKTGLWGEPVRQRKVVIVNDYDAPDPKKKSYPEGHVKVTRFMGVPLFDGKKIVALAGMSNKETGYDDYDALEMTLLLEGMWRITSKAAVMKEKEELQNKLFQAQKADALGELAGGIAHDFNNIVTTIKTLSSLAMNETPSGDPKTNFLNQITEVAERASNLTRQLLILSKNHPLKLMPLDINSAIKDIVNILSPVIGENISFKIDFKDRVCEIKADKGSIEQMCLNLIMNARDAMPRGGAITFRTENIEVPEGQYNGIPEAAKGRLALLTIEDTGEGMGEDIIQHIFKPLFTTKGPGKGTGLGLAVVDNIIKAHNGWITVSSEPGKGATFKVFLPAAELPAAAPAKKPVPPPSDDIKGKGERILLVEDEKMLRKSVKIMLTINGYKVVEASGAKEAAGIFETEKGNFDLIFSDIVLMDEDGIELAEKLSSKKPGLKVLLTSGYMDMELHWSGINKKGYSFLQKPYEPDALLRNIREVLSA